MKNKLSIKVAAVLCILALFSSCNDEALENSPQTLVENSLTSYLPGEFNGISLDDISTEQIKSGLTNQIQVIVSSKNEIIDEYKLELLKEATLNNIPVLIEGNASKMESISAVTGINPEEAGFYLIYNQKEKGITSEFFPSKSSTTQKSEFKGLNLDNLEVTPELKEKINAGLRAENHTDLEINEKWEEFYLNMADLKQNKESIDKENKEAFLKENPEKEESMTIQWDTDAPRIIREDLLTKRFLPSSTTDNKSNPAVDYTNYAIKSGVFNIVKEITNRPWPVNDDDTFVKYRMFWTVAKGSYNGHSEERIFVSSHFSPNPGTRIKAADSYAPIAPFCAGRDELLNVMENFQTQIHIPNGFDYDEYGPKAGSVGSGTYSNSINFGIKLKPLKPAEFVEISFGFSKSYSYSVQDFYFTNQTQNVSNRQKMYWEWTPGNCYYGAYDGGNGFLKNYNHTVEGIDNLFCGVNNMPVPMRQTNGIQVYQVVSKPLSQVNIQGGYINTPFKYYVGSQNRDLTGFVGYYFFCAGGIPYIEQSIIHYTATDKNFKYNVSSLL